MEKLTESASTMVPTGATSAEESNAYRIDEARKAEIVNKLKFNLGR